MSDLKWKDVGAETRARMRATLSDSVGQVGPATGGDPWDALIADAFDGPSGCGELCGCSRTGARESSRRILAARALNNCPDCKGTGGVSVGADAAIRAAKIEALEEMDND